MKKNHFRNLMTAEDNKNGFDSEFAETLYAENRTDEYVNFISVWASLGDPEAQYALGDCYENGKGVAVNKIAANEWYKRAADQGNPKAQFTIGVSFLGSSAAVEWLQKAADQELILAQLTLGIIYDEGIGVAKNDKKAFKWYRKAAQQGEAEAQYNLAKCYEYGKGIKANDTLAVQWYTAAAVQGFAEAQHSLAKCYKYGKGIKANDTLADKWYGAAAEQGFVGPIEAQDQLNEYYNNGETPKPINEENNVKLQERSYKEKSSHELLTFYFELLVTFFQYETDYEAAKQGEAKAQAKLGMCYNFGSESIKKDEIQAFKWLSKAAEQNIIEAQFMLGNCYYYGNGVEEDKTQTYYWWKKAADRGFPIPEDILAELEKIQKNNECTPTVSLDEYMAKTMALLSNMSNEILSLRTENIQLKQHMDDMQTRFSSMHQTLIETKQLSNETNTTVKEISQDIKDIKSFIKTDLSQIIRKEREELNLQLKKISDNDDERERRTSEMLRRVNDSIAQSMQKCCESPTNLINVENELINEFGSKIWDRLAPYTKTALKSARLLWKQCCELELETGFDYSGICICATSALENELKLLFFTGFQNFLEKTSKPDEQSWPKALLYISEKNGHKVVHKKMEKYFSMGNLPYLLNEAGDRSYQTDSERDLMRKKRKQYLSTVVKEQFISQNDPTLVFTQMKIGKKSFLSRCEDIREQYRNAAAHSAIIERDQAQKCYKEIVVNDLSDKTEAQQHLENINNILIILYSILQDDYSPAENNPNKNNKTNCR